VKKFKHLPIETENRLEDKLIRENFIKRIFSEDKIEEIKDKLKKI